MRRRTAVILVLALVVPVLAMGLVAGLRTAVLARVAASALGALVNPPQAAAQTPMEFKPVPPESVPQVEREHRRRHLRVSTTVSSEPAAPPAPATPGVPPLPPAPASHVGDITRVGTDIHVAEDEVVQGTVMTWRGDVTVEGTVHGDVVAAGGDVYLQPTAHVDGDVVCLGGELHEEPGAYVSGEKVTVAGRSGARFVRQLARREGILIPAGAEEGLNALRTVAAVMRFLFALGFTLLIAWIFRSRISAGAEVFKRQPALSLGIGVLVHALAIPSIIALVIVVAILCITIIGIPLALAALLGYALFFVVFWLFGLTVGAAVVGERLLAGRGTAVRPPWQYALAGVLLVAGTRLLGRVFESIGVAGFGGIGTALVVLSLLVGIVLGTVGGGAWLKWEFESGLLGRWWGRARSGNGWRASTAPASAAPGPAPGAAGPVAPAPEPPRPVAPPEAFMPPGPGSPPAPPGPTPSA
jgi:hypothetical protein